MLSALSVRRRPRHLLQHGDRLAMLGIVGLASKASDTDIGVLQQLGLSFSSPEFTSKAGFYFPRASKHPPLPPLCHLSLLVSASPAAEECDSSKGDFSSPCPC